MFQRRFGDWRQYRAQFELSQSDEVDLHFGRRDPSAMRYEEAMDNVRSLVEHKLCEAQRHGRPYLMFIHGSSTSRRGRRTARSVVRGFMRSPSATPLIERSGCIQHATVFLAKLRPAQ
jgi:hypothetical protein